MDGTTIKQKKDHALLLYTKENLSQSEMAERVGVSRVTINKWINDGKWDLLRVSISMMNETVLRNYYQQMIELQASILNRKPGERLPLPAEAAAQKDISISIKNLQTELGLSEITSVFGGLIQFLRMYDSRQVKEITPLLDAYVKSKLA
jgi:DNA-binding XRE family transcriptional regulator